RQLSGRPADLRLPVGVGNHGPATTSDEYGGVQVGKRDSTQGRKDARAQKYDETECQSDTVRHLLFSFRFHCVFASLRPCVIWSVNKLARRRPEFQAIPLAR